MSPSARKVWIEIYEVAAAPAADQSPSARKVWIEIKFLQFETSVLPSPSARKVWIEITTKLCCCIALFVTFREEGVD